MEVILSTILIALLVAYGIRAYQYYPNYQNSIFKTLLPSYLEYFYRVAIRKDCSYSSHLQKYIGTHRMTYTTLQNSERKITSKFVVLIYSKGIALISCLNFNGIISGTDEDKHWFIRSENKLIKISNPIIESNKYVLLLQKKYPDLHIHQIVACDDELDISKLKCKFTVCNDCNIIQILQESTGKFIDENTIIESFERGKSFEYRESNQ